MGNETKLTVKYCLFQSSYWMTAAVALAYVTPLLEAKGFSSLEIGILNAVKYTSVVFFQVWIASFSDKHAKTVPLKYIIGVLAVIGIVASYVFWALDAHFWIALIIFIVFGATVNCISPLIDSLSIQYMNHGRRLNYTFSRACGSASWAVFCIITGIFSDAFGANHILLLQMLFLCFLLFFNLIMDPVDFSWKKDNEESNEKNSEKSSEKISGKSSEKSSEKISGKSSGKISEKSSEKSNGKSSETKKVHTTWYVLHNFPKYTLFLVACMLVFMGYNMNATFLIDVIRDLGGSHTHYGVAQFVLAMGEIPTALIFMKLKKRFSVDSLMVCCALFCTLRAAATTFAPSVTMLILAQGIELLGLGIFYAGSVYFVMENLPKGDVVKGVSLINVATVGVGEAIASLLCGVIKENMGLYQLMLISILVSLLGFFVMLVMRRANAKL